MSSLKSRERERERGQDLKKTPQPPPPGYFLINLFCNFIHCTKQAAGNRLTIRFHQRNTKEYLGGKKHSNKFQEYDT